MIQTRSNFDNCIFHSAIQKNEWPYDDGDVLYLERYIVQGLQSAVEEYYYRSERIIAKIRELDLDNQETWNDIDKKHVKGIIDCIKNNNYVDVIDKIREMLENLEQKYGVE